MSQNHPHQVEVLEVVHNVKISVPPTGARWRVGSFNILHPEDIKKFGEGLQAIKTGIAHEVCGPEERVFFSTGLVVGGGANRVILNRTFWDLSPNDFGQTVNCNMEVKKETIGDKTYTSVAFTKANGYWKKDLKFDLTGQADTTGEGTKAYPILGTKGQLVVTTLPEPKINVNDFFKKEATQKTSEEAVTA